MTRRPLRVVYDLRGAQSRVHHERGIARWVRGHASALAEHPDVELVALVDPARPDPGLVASERIAQVSPAGLSRAAAARIADVHHIGSAFELDIPAAELIPAALRRPGVVRSVTLYDVIPLAWPIEDRGIARRWRMRAELLRGADGLLAISRFSAGDAAARLGIPRSRLHVVGTGVAAPATAPPEDAGRAEAPFVLYAGGTEHPRKNLLRLVEAFARVGARIRAGHRLVVAGRLAPGVAEGLRERARATGVGDALDLPGFVPDGELLAMMRRCACFVYPSLYEGFGLPIVEAMAAGAPVVFSSTTSCGEIPAPEVVRFDPRREESIAGAIERVLSDPALAARLRSEGPAVAARYRWEAVADRSVFAWRRLLSGAGGRRPRRPRTLTVLATGEPEPLSPAAAAQLLVAAASERMPVQLGTLTPLRPRWPSVRLASPFRHPAAPAWRNGPVVHVIETPGDASRAAELFAATPGLAVVWDLDRTLGGDRRNPAASAIVALRRLVRSGAVVAAASDEDAGLLARFAPRSGRVPVLPPPLGWTADAGGLSHQPTLEGLLMLGPRRAEVRAARPIPLAMAGWPPRLGPVRSRHVHAIAEAAGAGDPVRIAILGEVADDDHGDARGLDGPGTRWNILARPWPGRHELMAWATAATAVLVPAGASASARGAGEDLAATAGLPVVPGLADARDARRITRALTGDAAPAGIPSERQPHAVADALLDLLPSQS